MYRLMNNILGLTRYLKEAKLSENKAHSRKNRPFSLFSFNNDQYKTVCVNMFQCFKQFPETILVDLYWHELLFSLYKAQSRQQVLMY